MFLFIIYAISRIKFSPIISVMVSGQKNVTPIPLPSSEGSIYIGLTTNRKGTVIIEELQILFDEAEVQLELEEKPQTSAWFAATAEGSVDVTVRERIATDRETIPHEEGKRAFSYNHDLPDTFIISGPPKIKKQYIKLYVFKYKTLKKDEQFSLKLQAKAKLDEYELKPPFDMFPNIKRTHTEELQFAVEQDLHLDKNQRLVRYGFPIPPGYAIEVGKTS